MTSTGKSLRLARLLRGPHRRSRSLAFDHGLHLGTAPGAADLPRRRRRGRRRALRRDHPRPPGRSNAPTTCWRSRRRLPSSCGSTRRRCGGADSASAGDAEDETRLVSSVEEAIRLGADAAICYLFIGQHDLSRETRSMINAAASATEARRWGPPLVIEPMAARGGRLDPFERRDGAR